MKAVYLHLVPSTGAVRNCSSVVKAGAEIFKVTFWEASPTPRHRVLWDMTLCILAPAGVDRPGISPRQDFGHIIYKTNNEKQTLWPESANKPYRPSRFSAKLVPTFPDRGVSRGERGRSPRPYSRISRPEPLLYLPSSSSIVFKRLSGPRSRPSTSKKFS
jgi:hypothetical protein